MCGELHTIFIYKLQSVLKYVKNLHLIALFASNLGIQRKTENFKMAANGAVLGRESYRSCEAWTRACGIGTQRPSFHTVRVVYLWPGRDEYNQLFS